MSERTRKCKDCEKEIDWIYRRVRCVECYWNYLAGRNLNKVFNILQVDEETDDEDAPTGSDECTC